MSDLPIVKSSLTGEELARFMDFAAQVAQTDDRPAFSEQTLVEVGKANHDTAAEPTGTDLAQPAPPSLTVWLTADNQPVGIAVALLAHRGQPGLIEGAVLSDHRGSGLGGKLTTALTEVLAQQAPGVYHLWQHQILGEGGSQQQAAVAALTDRAHFSPVRELHKLRLPLTEQSRAEITQAAEASPLPQGLELSTFVPGDDDSDWLSLNAEAFADHPEQGSLTQTDLEQRVAAGWFRPEGFFLAREGHRLAGFHWTKIPENQFEEGEVYAVGISPEQQGRGVGRALTLTGMSYLAQATSQGKQLEKIVLYVDAKNTAAMRLYRSLGFEPETIDLMYTGTI